MKILLLAMLLFSGVVQAQIEGGINNGLVLYWRLNGDATDSSPQGRNGTVTGTTTNWVTGVLNKAFYGDGSTQKIGWTGQPVPGYPFTISGWFKAGAKCTITSSTDNSHYFTVGYAAGSTTNVNCQTGDTPGTTTIAFGPVPSNGWTYVAAVWLSSTNRSLYVNGLFKLSSNESRSVNFGIQNRFSVNYLDRLSPGYFPGGADDVRVYNRALSGPEIAWLFTAKPWGAQ